jgi:hypothetical protein
VEFVTCRGIPSQESAFLGLAFGRATVGELWIYFSFGNAQLLGKGALDAVVFIFHLASTHILP